MPIHIFFLDAQPIRAVGRRRVWAGQRRWRARDPVLYRHHPSDEAVVGLILMGKGNREDGRITFAGSRNRRGLHRQGVTSRGHGKVAGTPFLP